MKLNKHLKIGDDVYQINMKTGEMTHFNVCQITLGNNENGLFEGAMMIELITGDKPRKYYTTVIPVQFMDKNGWHVIGNPYDYYLELEQAYHAANLMGKDEWKNQDWYQMTKINLKIANKIK